MSDYKYLFADEYCDVFQSKLVLSSNKLEQVFFTAADDNANDIEEARDDSPSARGGWGGKEFYVSLSESTHAIMTVAKKIPSGKCQKRI